VKRALCLVPLALLVGACSGPGNTGRLEPNPELWAQIPWANYGTPQFYEKADGSRGGPKISGAPVYPPIGENQPDPGSRPIDCSVLDDIELSPYWVETFEPYAPGMTPTGQPYWGVATAWASYDDGTEGSFRTPGDVGWYPDLGGGDYLDEGHPQGGPTPYGRPGRATWGMPADRHPAEVGGEHTGVRPDCDGAANDFALHYRGGRFNYYGGGFAHALSPPVDSGLVVADDGEWILKEPCPPGSDLCASEPGYWDVSAYDGVAFWARRGPDGGSSVLVGFQEKHTSQELNSISSGIEPFCKRFKECKPRCTNGFECTSDGQGTQRCMPEGYSIPPDSSLNVALKEFLFPPCGESTCAPPSFNLDPEFNNTTCEAVTFTGLEQGYWCTAPDRPVPPPPERCGDGFVSRITLSTDWQLYKMPFDRFRQAGNGKPAPYFDLETLHTLFFEAPVGWADIYVDNVSFYRNK
jgi:hypothetical protein